MRSREGGRVVWSEIMCMQTLKQGRHQKSMNDVIRMGMGMGMSMGDAGMSYTSKGVLETNDGEVHAPVLVHLHQLQQHARASSSMAQHNAQMHKCTAA